MAALEKPCKESIVFVHGICHGAWCWEKYFTPYFSERGYRCYPVDLRGHGNSKESLKGACLSDYVDDTRKMVCKCIIETGKFPFLVGHSMGGAVAQRFLGQYPDMVSGAVLLASATAPRMPRIKTILSLKDPNLNCAFMVALGRKDNWAENVHNAAFFTGRNPAGERDQRINDTTPYEGLLQKESIRILLQDLYQNYSNNYKIDVPMFIIGSSADAYFPEESLKKTAKIYAKHKEPAYKCLNYLCHDMMLDPEWEKPAELILRFIENPDKFIKDNPRPKK